jgi:predicted membrane-bound spermidine synthase
LSDRRARIVLVLCGFNIAVLQLFLVKELSSLLLATEVALTLVTTAYFAGFSVGYLVAHRLSARTLSRIALAAFFLHLALPFVPRTLVGLFYDWDLRAFVPFALIAVAVFGGTAFYSIFLPRLVERALAGVVPFRVYMTFEVLGMLGGLVATFLLADAPFAIVYAASAAALIAILQFTTAPHLWGRATAALLAPFALTQALAFEQLDFASTAYAYRKIYDFSELRTIASVHSPYQRIAVVQAKSGTRYLYLDGFQHFGSSDLSRFNRLIAGLPSALNPLGSVLIVGSGSFFAADGAAETAARVTNVEIDERVAEIGIRDLRKGKHPAEKVAWSLVVDDAKHFVATTADKFDVVAMDIAGPFQFQVALLYTREFYEAAKRALTPRGVIAVQISGGFVKPGPNATRIAATLKAVFREVFVVDPEGGDTAFAYASDAPEFGAREIVAWLEAQGIKARVFGTDDVRLKVRATAPFSKGSMDTVVVEGLKRLWNRFFRARRP